MAVTPTYVAAELPSVAVALDATFEVVSVRGRREIARLLSRG